MIRRYETRPTSDATRLAMELVLFPYDFASIFVDILRVGSFEYDFVAGFCDASEIEE